MFTRILSMQVKPNATREFMEVLDKKILPTLRKQKGFKDEMLFVDPGGPEVMAISFWESKEHAEAYEHATYAEVLRAVEKVIENEPEVKTLQLAYSTMHKAGTVAYPKQSPNTTPTAGVGG